LFGAIRVTHSPAANPAKPLRIGYLGEMEKPAAPGFDIRIEGVKRTFRDQQPAAYDAALLLKRKNLSAVVTITNTATGAVITMLEDGRTA
jgi:hypothetical protein